MKNIFEFIVGLFSKKRPTVPVLRFDGVIGTGGGLGKGRINAENLESNIKKAFSTSKPSAVAIIINSPGGSPVQSSLIYQRVRYFAEKKDVPILVFIEDVAASGGYWLSCVGDEIFADKASIVGSIGVISASFGFSEAISKVGVERRVYTTGKSKGSLDPFKPERPEDVRMLKNIMNDTQEAFVDLVNLRRGSKLCDDDSIFTGAFWSGEKALKLGLIDGIGEIRTVLRQRFGNKVKLKFINKKKSFISGLVQGFSSPIINNIINEIENNAHWKRFGL
jgi:serine protease SohB